MVRVAERRMLLPKKGTMRLGAVAFCLGNEVLKGQRLLTASKVQRMAKFVAVVCLSSLILPAFAHPVGKPFSLAM